MKKIIALFLILILCFSATACSSEVISKKTSYGVDDFDKLLSTLPMSVTSVKYVVQDEEYKSLYPDMLQATIKNNSSHDIKNAVVAFVGWDANNLPVELKGSMDFTAATYVRKVNYDNINLVSGGIYGNSNGFAIDEKCNIKSFKAIVVSCETFDGIHWENPYYDEWCKLYEGVKFEDTLTVEVKVEDEKSTLDTAKLGQEETGLTQTLNENDILSKIEAQELKVIKTNYVVQDEEYKSLYPDMLQAIIKNDSSHDIKNVVIAFVAWDANNLPVKIKGSIDFSDGTYVKKVSYNDVNLVPGKTYGDSSGFNVDETCGIKTIKAIVVSYETFDGTSWENPHFNDWCTLYEGIKLK